MKKADYILIVSKWLILLFITLNFNLILHLKLYGEAKPLQTKEKQKVQKEEFLPRDILKKPNAPFSTIETTASGSFIKSFIVIVVFLLILFAIIKWMQKKKLNASVDHDDSVIHILKNSPLTTNKSIQIVEINSKIYILGVGDQAISVINTIDDPKEITEIKKQCQEENLANPKKGFKDILGIYFNSVSKKGNSGKIQFSSDNSTQFFNEQKNRLKQLRNKL